MRKLGVAALAAASVLGVGGPPQASSHVVAGPDLNSMLLTVKSLPAGWNEVKSVSGGVGCLHSILEPSGVHETARAGVTFVDRGNPPQLEEVLATYSLPAKTVYAKVLATLSACKSVSGTVNGIKAHGTVKQVAIPLFGQQSAGFEVEISVKTTPVDQDALVIRDGNILVGLSEGAIGKANLGQLEAFAKLALAKLPPA